MKINISKKLTEILTKELAYADYASNNLKNEMKAFEKKYGLQWEDFLTKFEKGELGDKKEWFSWYAIVMNRKDWDDTKKEIEKTINIPAS
jgi:hypothetical protein